MGCALNTTVLLLALIFFPGCDNTESDSIHKSLGSSSDLVGVDEFFKDTFVVSATIRRLDVDGSPSFSVYALENPVLEMGDKVMFDKFMRSELVASVRNIIIRKIALDDGVLYRLQVRVSGEGYQIIRVEVSGIEGLGTATVSGGKTSKIRIRPVDAPDDPQDFL